MFHGLQLKHGRADNLHVYIFEAKDNSALSKTITFNRPRSFPSVLPQNKALENVKSRNKQQRVFITR